MMSKCQSCEFAGASSVSCVQTENKSSIKKSVAANAKVFVFGGNGLVGVELISFLTSAELGYSKHFSQVTAVIRPESIGSRDVKKCAIINRLRSTGATILAGDTETASADEISNWLHGYDIAISAIGFFSPTHSIEHKILEAVQLAGVEWYIPSIFGSDNYRMYTGSVPFLAGKHAVIEAVKAAAGRLSTAAESGGGTSKQPKLNYFIVHNGLFFEYLLSKGTAIDTYSGIDIANSTITAPCSFDVSLTVTCVKDIARLTVEALIQRDEPYVKNQVLQFAGDTVSYNDLHTLLEQHFQRKFTKLVATEEQVNAAITADVNHQDLSNRFRLMYFKSPKEAICWPMSDTFNAQHAKHMQLMTVKDYLQQLYPKR